MGLVILARRRGLPMPVLPSRSVSVTKRRDTRTCRRRISGPSQWPTNDEGPGQSVEIGVPSAPREQGAGRFVQPDSVAGLPDAPRRGLAVLGQPRTLSPCRSPRHPLPGNRCPCSDTSPDSKPRANSPPQREIPSVASASFMLPAPTAAGSVCAFLESVYRAAGLRVGMYTSPHLVRFGERIQINRVPMSDEELARVSPSFGSLPERFPGRTDLLRVHHRDGPCAGSPRPAWIWWFGETGLGGRLDATNIVTPLASVVTRIGLDHQAVLGPTVARIAAEKAGIIKPGVPVVTAAGDPDTLAILGIQGARTGRPVPRHRGTRGRNPAGSGGTGRRTPARQCGARRRHGSPSPRISPGVRRCPEDRTRPCRMARTPSGPAPGIANPPPRWSAQSPGHRSPGDSPPGPPSGVRPLLIVGLLADKDWREMARLLAPLAGRILTVPVTSGRTVSAADLKAAFVASGLGRPVKGDGLPGRGATINLGRPRGPHHGLALSGG